jgi:hypothetical protein
MVCAAFIAVRPLPAHADFTTIPVIVNTLKGRASPRRK